MKHKLVELFTNDAVLLEVSMILNSVTDEAYLVGGAVRDALFMKEPKDFDFVVGNTGYDEMSEAFQLAGWEAKETGKEFLVLMVTKKLWYGKRVEFEIAMLRKDGTYLKKPKTVRRIKP